MTEEDQGNNKTPWGRGEDEILPSNETTSKFNIADLRKKLEEEEFEEGQLIPVHLVTQCKKNTYGGYSLRHFRFMYVLDADFRVEVKRPASHKDDGEEATPYEADKTLLFSHQDVAKQIENVQLDKGDTLPPHLRTRCEADLSIGGGYRIRIGQYLYLLDNDFQVTARMKYSY
jgi:hypothetical protein